MGYLHDVVKFPCQIKWNKAYSAGRTQPSFGEWFCWKLQFGNFRCGQTIFKIQFQLFLKKNNRWSSSKTRLSKHLHLNCIIFFVHQQLTDERWFEFRGNAENVESSIDDVQNSFCRSTQKIDTISLLRNIVIYLIQDLLKIPAVESFMPIETDRKSVV